MRRRSVLNLNPKPPKKKPEANTEEQVILDTANSNVKDRKCLKCDTVFRSRGPQNRICRDCAMSNARAIDVLSRYNITRPTPKRDSSG